LPENPSEIYAALDLGSNSFHLLVASIDKEQLQVIDKHKEMIRLAAGFDKKNRLSKEKQTQALDCLSRMGQRIGHLPNDHVRILGTNALRKAGNSRAFLKQARARLGHHVEVVSGREEARLLYLGVAHSLASSPTNRLVMDIGGGSTEMILGTNFDPMLMESMHIGCVQTSLRHFPDGKITLERWQAAQTAAMLQLQAVIREYQDLGWQQAVGASGTFKAAEAVMRAHGWSAQGITKSGLEKIKEKILDCGQIDNLVLDGLEARRAKVFPGGVVIIAALFEALGLEQVDVSDSALREGVVYDLAGRLHHNDIRERSVSALMERFNVDATQANSVVEVVNRLITASQNLQLTVSLREMVYWAALLHEIGLTIAHSQFQKHGAYLIQHADLPGFSRQEQNLLGFLVLSQRRKYPVLALQELSDYQRASVIAPSIILRLALLLSRSRRRLDITGINLDWQKNRLDINFPKGWLKENPLCIADLKQEQKFIHKADIGFQLNLH